jgi:hypothetical protein
LEETDPVKSNKAQLKSRDEFQASKYHVAVAASHNAML